MKLNEQITREKSKYNFAEYQVKIKPDGTQLVILITKESGLETLRFGVSGIIKNSTFPA